MLKFIHGLSAWCARHPRVARAFRLLLHPYVLFPAVTLAVFWPDGFNIGPANDGWRELGATPINLGRFGPRVFGNLPKVLGMHLVSGGFQGWELMLFILTALRGMLFYEIVKRVFKGFPLFAICCGLIALFHPADGVYFWMDSIGLDFAFVLALAACLAAVVHVETGSLVAAAVFLFFTGMTCFTYTAFQPLMLAFAVGVWILRRAEGLEAGVARLATVSLPVVLCIAFQMRFAGDRDGAISDFNLHRTLGGYLDEIQLFWQTTVGYFTVGVPPHLRQAALAAVLTWLVTRNAYMADEGGALPSRRPWRFYAVLVPGLLLLAAVSYLPYAVSLVRLGNQRQLFAAGIFIFMLMLLPVCLLLVRRLDRRFGIALAGLVAFTVTVVGLENRSGWVTVYRVNERLLSQVARLVPDPPHDAFIVVHMNRPMQVLDLEGLINRRYNINGALQFMYGDASIQGAFTDIYQTPFKFEPGGLRVMQMAPWEDPPLVPYDRLIIVDYPARGDSELLGRSWLQQQAPKGTDLSGYKPGDYGSAPGTGAAICTMFEKPFRPGYCH